MIEPAGKVDFSHAGDEQAEGDRLRVAVGELLVGRFRKQQVSPFAR